jgi:hypothetical protein
MVPHILRSASTLLVACCAAFAAESSAAGATAPGMTGEVVSTSVLLSAGGEEVEFSSRGDRLPDFSMVGYQFGERDEYPALQDLPAVRVEIASSNGDATGRIQEAIDKVSAWPVLPHGYRGVVRLGPGTALLENPLHIRAAGVILAGAPEAGATELIIRRGAGEAALFICGEGSLQPVEAGATEVVADYVPVGATAIEVNSPQAFAAGDQVLVRFAVNDRWISTLGMDRLAPKYETRNGEKVNVVKQWKSRDYVYDYQREIVEVEGNTLLLNIPMVQGLDRAFGKTTVMRYEFPGRIRNVGVCDLTFRAEFDDSIREPNRFLEGPEHHFTDEENARFAVHIDKAQHVWVTRCTARNFYQGLVSIDRQGSHVTVSHGQSLDPVSRVAGGRRYPFYLLGQLNLVKHCFSREGRHDFVAGSRVAGPNVFYDCLAENAYHGSEPHHRMATGLLYDNVRVQGPGAFLAAGNRGNNGTGHGWMGAQIVFWNCSAPMIIVQDPPIGKNFAIGSGDPQDRSGKVFAANLSTRLRLTNQLAGQEFVWDGRTPFIGDAHFEVMDGPVKPHSLYRFQLERRLPQSPATEPETRKDSLLPSRQRAVRRTGLFHESIVAGSILGKTGEGGATGCAVGISSARLW